MQWPAERDVDAFYGDPRGAGLRGLGTVDPDWFARSIVYVVPPYPMAYEGREVRKIACHRRCAFALATALQRVMTFPGWATDPRLRVFDGSFNFRLKRGSLALSMHSYGIAFDFDAARNPMGEVLGLRGFQPHSTLVQAFKSVGAKWGGDFHGRKDPMHFQFTS
jgi:hypothetical protein